MLATALSLPPHRLERKILDDSDYERVFNDLLMLETDTGLSQVFQLGEVKVNAFVTEGPAPKNLLTRMARRVINVGDDPQNELCLGKVKLDSIPEAIENFFKGESKNG